MAVGVDDRLTTDDFDYPFDERLIAQRPVAQRDESRLLVIRRSDGTLEDRVFRDVQELVAPGDVVVVNDSRVFRARLLGHKPTGAPAEILLIRPLDAESRRWQALVRPGGKLKPGRRVRVSEDLWVEIETGMDDGSRAVRLVGDLPPTEAIRRYGHVPLPPYIRRSDDASDACRYQTVYAQEEGSVAAPTAGLHFTQRTLDDLAENGVVVVPITLHVGPGTFRPVQVDDPAKHELDAEWYRVPESSAAAIAEARERGGRIWAVGTTVVRALESVAVETGAVRAGEGWTGLFIRPGYRFRAVDRLITNFHLPRSSLLMLVAAFAGYELTRRAYRHAVDQEYRFYSYGDACAII